MNSLLLHFVFPLAIWSPYISHARHPHLLLLLLLPRPPLPPPSLMQSTVTEIPPYYSVTHFVSAVNVRSIQRGTMASSCHQYHPPGSHTSRPAGSWMNVLQRKPTLSLYMSHPAICCLVRPGARTPLWVLVHRISSPELQTDTQRQGNIRFSEVIGNNEAFTSKRG